MKHLILLLLLGLFIVPSLAQDEFVNNNCPYTGSEYYIPDVVIRYEADARRLVMVNLHDGSIAKLIDENIDILHLGVFSWSPNCRYLLALIENNVDGGDILPAALWDTASGTRLATIDTYEMELPRSYGLQILWKPDSSQAVIDTDTFGTNRFLLWRSADNSLLPLTGSVDYSDFSFPDLLNAYWDEGRNRLYLSAYNCVIVLDLSTGQRTACYKARQEARYVATTFYVSPDESQLVVFTNAAPRRSEGYPAYLTIWSLDTDASVEVNLGVTLLMLSKSL